MNLWYDPTTLPKDLQRALATLGVEYPISPEPAAATVEVRFEQSDQPGAIAVSAPDRDAVARVSYHTVAQECRGVGVLLGLEAEQAQSVEEQAPFEMLGLMLDC